MADEAKQEEDVEFELDRKTVDKNSENAKPSKSKKLLLIIISLVFLLIGIYGAVYFFLTEGIPEKEVVTYAPAYFPLPDIKLRMRYLDNTIGYMVVGLTLRISEDANAEDYKIYEPEILDTLHTFLGSLNLDEFTPAAVNRFSAPVGLERVRQNIIVRLNTILAPLKVKTVLFRKLITQ